MLCLYLLTKIVYIFYFLTILKQSILLTYICQTAKHGYPISMHGKILQNTPFLKCGQQIWFWLFIFRPITSKQCTLTAIDIHVISFLGDSKLTQQPALLEAPGLISGPDKDFYMFAFCFVVVVVFVVTLVLFAIPFTMLLIFH